MEKRKPVLGKFYLPWRIQYVAECEDFYHFKDSGIRFNKALDFNWVECEPPQHAPILSEADMKKPYDNYSLWSQQLAQTETVEELQKVINLCEFNQIKNRESVIRITNKNSNAYQARAQIKNVSQANYEKITAYKAAIQIHKDYPNLAKK